MRPVSKVYLTVLLTGLISLFCSRQSDPVSGGTTDSGNARICATVMYGQYPASFASVRIRNTDFISGADRSFETIIDTITDGNGNFTVDIKNGTFTIEIIKDDTLAVTSGVSIDSAGELLQLDTLFLDRTGSISGTLLSQTPVSGFVRISGYEHTAQIDENGNFTFPNLAQGNYALHFEINGLHTSIIPEIPVSSGERSIIKDIDLFDSNWTIIPPCTYQADSLAIQEFLDSQKITIPYIFSGITDTVAGRIRTLNLSGLSLTTLHPSIGKCDFLYTLNIANNNITIIPEQIKGCRLLSAFIAEKNSIETIPMEISRFRFLEFLKLSYNKIQSIPDSIFFMPKLRKLSIGANPIDSLSALIGNLTMLEQLDIFECNLGSIPEEIGKLTRLNQIWAAHNRITTLPKSITDLKMLETFQISYNNLSELPEHTGELSSLKNLYLYDNQLADLPVSVLNLDQLQELSLDKNQLCNLSSELSSWVEKHTDQDWKSSQVGCE